MKLDHLMKIFIIQLLMRIVLIMVQKKSFMDTQVVKHVVQKYENLNVDYLEKCALRVMNYLTVVYFKQILNKFGLYLFF